MDRWQSLFIYVQTCGTFGLLYVCLHLPPPFICFMTSPVPPHRQLIYNYPEQLFAQAGVMAIEHADFTGVERLALVTGTPRLKRPQRNGKT